VWLLLLLNLPRLFVAAFATELIAAAAAAAGK
jgi:hypothetical protein